MDQKGKLALVTGATSGIGLELARIHAQRGGDLVLVARREERLKNIKEDLEKQYGVSVQIIVNDLSLPSACEEVYKETKGSVDYLINNAGFGLAGFYHETSFERNREMIELNITALAALTHLFLQDMAKRKSGRILNVSSVAGFLPGPLQATYYATKAFVNSFSQAIANEVKDKNITVSALCPGPVKTEFGEVAGFKRKDEVFLKKLAAAKPEDTARDGYEGMLKGKVIIVSGLSNRMQVAFMRFAPRGLLVRISRQFMEMFMGKKK